MKIVILILMVSTQTLAQDFTFIKDKLETIYDHSLELRSQVLPTIKKHGRESIQMDSLNVAIIYFDSIALVTVLDFIDKYGWLGKSQVGEKANQTLFIVIQHTLDNTLREKYFPLLKASAEKKESQQSDMATMLDRILVEKGELQVYGTQSRMVDGALELYPIRDSKEVNKRRRKVGLSKLK